MSGRQNSGRFWSGAGAGLGLGLAAALWLGWQLSGPPPASSVTPSGPPSAPPAPARAPQPQPSAEPPAAPQFSPPAQRLAGDEDRAEAGDVVDVPIGTPAPSDSLAQVMEPDPSPPAELPPEEPWTAPPAEPLRERFDSLSDAMLTGARESPADGSPTAPAEQGAPIADGSAPQEERAWIDVWQPFVSPVSARGFADRLELLTGFTYRVQRRSGDGLHQVAVQPIDGYAPAQMLQQIADRSGLAMVSP